MDLVVPLCGPWGDFLDVTFIVREGGCVAVGRTDGGFDERVVDLEEVAGIIAPYLDLYDSLASDIGAALGVSYVPERSDVVSWLRRHVEFIDAAGAKWGRLIDRVGPFTVKKLLRSVYMPYIGHTLSLTYVAYPYPDAVVYAENKGRVMAIGSVVVEWGGVKVASVGIRTLSGALLLAQASPELLPVLEELKKALSRFVESFGSISRCR